MPAVQLMNNGDDLEVNLMAIVLDENNKFLRKESLCFYNKQIIYAPKRIMGEPSTRVIPEVSTRPLDFISTPENVDEQLRWDYRYRVALIINKYHECKRPLATWKGSVRFIDDTGRILQPYSPYGALELDTNTVLLGIMYKMPQRTFSKNGVLPIILERKEFLDIFELIDSLELTPKQ